MKLFAVCLMALGLGFGCKNATSPEVIGLHKDAITISDVRHMDMGINLSVPNDWGREHIFIDLIKTARPWTLVINGKIQNRDSIVPIDTAGYPDFSQLPEGHSAASYMMTEQEGHYPAGNYDCYYTGDANVNFMGTPAQIVSKDVVDGLHHVVVRITPTERPIILEVTASNPDNPMRDLKFYLPNLDWAASFTSFNPSYTKQLRPFRVLRFMQWMQTINLYSDRKWEERNTPDTLFQNTRAGEGIALEYIIELCNTTRSNPWFSMPHLYSDGYVRNFAQMVHDNLYDDAIIYVEFSNEIWNPQYPASQWATQNANTLDIPVPYFVADKAKEVWDVWLDVFSDNPDRIVRVVSGQASNFWFASKQLERLGAGNADMVAVGGYFSANKNITDQYTSDVTSEQILTDASAYIDQAVTNLLEHWTLVDRYSLSAGIGVYEGGQHIIGKQGWYQQAWDAQLLPSIYDHYTKLFEDSDEIGVKLFCMYDFISDRTSKYGSWGQMEFMDQYVSDTSRLKLVAPKMAATLDFSRRKKALTWTASPKNARLIEPGGKGNNK